MRGRQHWIEEEEKQCRMCGEGTENLSHVLKECEATKDEIRIEELLNEDGRGLEVMKRIQRAREEKGRDEEGVKGESGIGIRR